MPRNTSIAYVIQSHVNVKALYYGCSKFMYTIFIQKFNYTIGNSLISSIMASEITRTLALFLVVMYGLKALRLSSYIMSSKIIALICLTWVFSSFNTFTMAVTIISMDWFLYDRDHHHKRALMLAQLIQTEASSHSLFNFDQKQPFADVFRNRRRC